MSIGETGRDAVTNAIYYSAYYCDTSILYSMALLSFRSHSMNFVLFLTLKSAVASDGYI